MSAEALRERREKWAELLESGEFEQATGRLRNRDGDMCCLGVACELYRRETGRGAWVESEDGDGALAFALEATQDDGILPMEVTRWLGLDGESGGYLQGTRSLLQDNDVKQMSFEQIAETIREEPDGLLA